VVGASVVVVVVVVDSVISSVVVVVVDAVEAVVVAEIRNTLNNDLFIIKVDSLMQLIERVNEEDYVYIIPVQPATVALFLQTNVTGSKTSPETWHFCVTSKKVGLVMCIRLSLFINIYTYSQ